MLNTKVKSSGETSRRKSTKNEEEYPELDEFIKQMMNAPILPAPVEIKKDEHGTSISITLNINLN